MRSIIFIDRSNLYYYGGNVHAALTMPLQPTVVKDLEVIDGDMLEKQIDELITKNKIEPTETSIILARQSSFEKLLPANTPKLQIEQEKAKFTENVPFDEILDQTIVTDKGTQFVAVNGELVSLLKAIFEKHHFTIDTVASIAAMYPQGDVTFNTASAQDLLKNSAQIRQHAFLKIEEKLSENEVFEAEFGEKKKKSKIYLLLGAFAILILILVFMLMNRNTAKSKTTKKRVPTKAPIATTQIPVAAEATGSAVPNITELPKSTLTIQILNGSGITGQADRIKENLEKIGYTSISTGNAPTVQSQRTLIITKPRVSATQKQEITTIVEDIAGAVLVQENAGIEVDILITTARDSSLQNPSAP